MVQLIRGDGDYFSLDDVKRLDSKGGGRYVVHGRDGETLDSDNNEILDRVISLVAVQGEWECLTKAEKNDKRGYYSEPVIAWGLTVSGTVVPITPVSTDGQAVDYALRKAGEAGVFAPHRTYDNLDEWLAE